MNPVTTLGYTLDSHKTKPIGHVKEPRSIAPPDVV